MRVVFLGSGSFAIPSLEALLRARHEVVGVVTQPDRESGRGRGLAAPPVKPVALAHGLPVLQPARVRAPEALAGLAALRAELHVVVAYGQILPRAVLELPRLGTINVHASLLPRYRGAAPIQWAIARGEHETGVTTMLLDEGLDTGPILQSRSTPIGPEENAAELQTRLAILGGELLIETVRGLEGGGLVPAPQDDARATLAPMLKKEDGRLDWGRPAGELHDLIRGFSPWPGGFTSWRGQHLKAHAARIAADGPGTPGTIVETSGDQLVVACGGATRLGLLEVQLEGRRRMSGAAFAAGAHPGPDERLG